VVTSPPIDRVFHALGDPTRRAIVARLAHGPQSVSALAKPLGITLTAVAQHVQVLEDSGLASTSKVGRVRSCSLETRGLDALEHWAREQKSLWERRFDRLEDLLNRMDQ
jgi:DNA-binding transcriptional ArsR family regulator